MSWREVECDVSESVSIVSVVHHIIRLSPLSCQHIGFSLGFDSRACVRSPSPYMVWSCHLSWNRLSTYCVLIHCVHTVCLYKKVRLNSLKTLLSLPALSLSLYLHQALTFEPEWCLCCKKGLSHLCPFSQHIRTQGQLHTHTHTHRSVGNLASAFDISKNMKSNQQFASQTRIPCCVTPCKPVRRSPLDSSLK